MNKIFIIIMLVVGAIVTIAFLPTLQDTIDANLTNTTYIEVVHEHTSQNDFVTAEPITLAFTPFSIEHVNVQNTPEDLLESEYTVVSNTITVDGSLSTTSVIIIVNYTYEVVDTYSYGGALALIPFMVVIVVVVYFIKFNK